MPPLTNTLQNYTVTVEPKLGTAAEPLGLCVGINADITSGTLDEVRVNLTSCTQQQVANPVTVIRTYHWSDGNSSTVTAQRRIQRVGGQTVVTFDGTVTAGDS